MMYATIEDISKRKHIDTSKIDQYNALLEDAAIIIDEANIQIRQVSQYNAENARSTQGVDSRNEVLRRVKNLENMLKRQDVAAYFYLDKKLVAKTIAEPIRDIIENNKKLDTMLMGART